MRVCTFFFSFAFDAAPPRRRVDGEEESESGRHFGIARRVLAGWNETDCKISFSVVATSILQIRVPEFYVSQTLAHVEIKNYSTRWLIYYFFPNITNRHEKVKGCFPRPGRLIFLGNLRANKTAKNKTKKTNLSWPRRGQDGGTFFFFRRISFIHSICIVS